MNLRCLDTCRQVLIEFAAKHDQKTFERVRRWSTFKVLMVQCKQALLNKAQGYATILAMMHTPDSQTVSTKSAFAAARKKIGTTFHRGAVQLIFHTSQAFQSKKSLWYGHRIFAIDGTKVNVSRKLLAAKYPRVNKSTFYPQALITVLFQLRSKLVADFIVSRHNSEAKNVRSHLSLLQPGDVVVYDRLFFLFISLPHILATR